jgi:LPXTG-motif cell wall-anchored protein
MQTTSGNEYAVYKLFGATVDSKTRSVVYTGDIPDALKDYFTKDETTGYITATDAAWAGEEMSSELSKALQEWVKTETATVSATSEGGAVQFTGLDYGYYVVTTSSEAAPIIVTTTNPTAILYDKNYTTPTGFDGKPIKYLTNPEQDTYAALGDTVGFTIKFVAVNSYTPSTTEGGETAAEKAVMQYTITDTPTNLKIDLTSLKVKVGDEVLTTGEVANPSPFSHTKLYGYKVEQNDDGVMTITIQWAYVLDVMDDNAVDFKYKNNSTVEITYEAEVTSDDKTVEGAKNDAKISYDEREGTVDGGTTVESRSIQLQKVDMYGNQLEGAKFKLQAAEMTNDDEVITDEDGNPVFPDGSNKYINPFIPLTAETDADGNITGYHVRNSVDLANGETVIYEIEAGNVTIKGLDLDKEYRLVEIEAPTGYNLLEEPVTVEKTTDADGKVTGFAPVVVENSNGSSLPQTGGIGTTIFYVVGGVLVVAALVILITRKRVHMEEK